MLTQTAREKRIRRALANQQQDKRCGIWPPNTSHFVYPRSSNWTKPSLQQMPLFLQPLKSSLNTSKPSTTAAATKHGAATEHPPRPTPPPGRHNQPTETRVHRTGSTPLDRYNRQATLHTSDA